MEYSKIVAVSGLPGLFELVNSKNDGAIVRSLEDKSTKFVSSRIHQFSHLESIEIYTVRENVNLADILNAMKASEEKLPDEKDAVGLRKYFEKVYGDIDFDRVYSSDLKKMVKWFSILDKNQIEIKLTEPEEEPEEEPAPEPEPVEEKKPAPGEKKAKEKTAEPEKPATRAKEKEKTKEKESRPAAKEKDKPKEKAKEKPKEKSKEKESKPSAKSSAKKPASKKKDKK